MDARAALRYEGDMSEEPLLLYRTPQGPFVARAGHGTWVAAEWDDLLNASDLGLRLRDALSAASLQPLPVQLLAPIVSQEIWAAGVTYWRSRTARME